MNEDQSIFWLTVLPLIYLSTVFFSPAVFLTGLASGAAFAGSKAYLIGALLAGVAFAASSYHLYERLDGTPAEAGLFVGAAAVAGAIWVALFRLGRSLFRRRRGGTGA